jgi:hypothetical protein
MTRLVGFTGYPYHGKTTSANALIKVYGYERMSFAAPIKRMLSTLAGVTDAHLYGDKKEEPIQELGGRTSRYLMEALGTRWGREMVDDMLWAKQALVLAAQAMREGKYVVFDDVRFHNEVMAIHSLKGVVFRVKRPHVPVDMSLPANQEVANLPVNAEIDNDFPSTGLVPWERMLGHRVLHVCKLHGVELDLRNGV